MGPEDIGDIPLHDHPYQRETSEAAWRSVEASGWASKCAKQAYRLLYHHGPLTLDEVELMAAEEDNRNPRGRSESTIVRRLYDLRDNGLAGVAGVRECGVTRNDRVTWDVTAHLCPEERVKKKKKCKHCDALLDWCSRVREYMGAEAFEQMQRELRSVDV